MGSSPSTAGKYACTFKGCDSSFDRSAWEAHEKATHSQLELWKCCVGSCIHRSFRSESHANHLTNQHGITAQVEIATKTTEGHIGGSGGAFWCGFCRKAVKPVGKKWQHVGTHFDRGEVIEDYVFV